MSEQPEENRLSPDIEQLLAELSQAMVSEEAVESVRQVDAKLARFEGNIVTLHGALIATQLVLPYLVDGLADVEARFRQPGIFMRISGHAYAITDQEEERGWAAAFRLIAERAHDYGVSYYERQPANNGLPGEPDRGFAVIRSLTDPNHAVVGVFNDPVRLGSVAFSL